jgi:hypothetical protein
MTKPKFTPGPWVKVGRYLIRPEKVTEYVDAPVARTRSKGLRKRSDEESEANAHLIAAAPDLYDMLKTIENDDGIVPGWLWDRIQATLAKARGEDA